MNLFPAHFVDNPRADCFSDPVFRSLLQKPPEHDPMAAIQLRAQLFCAPALTWNDLAKLRRLTDPPLILKGILRPEDARRAVQAGVDRMIVSNHGGCQINGVVTPSTHCRAWLTLVWDRIDVLFASGICGGSDVLKAFALGASAVLLSRPCVWRWPARAAMV